MNGLGSMMNDEFHETFETAISQEQNRAELIITEKKVLEVYIRGLKYIFHEKGLKG